MEKSIKAYDIIFKGLTKDYILSLFDKKELSYVIPVNTELIIIAHENKRFLEILNRNISTIDGQIPYWLIKMKYKNLLIEKLSGSDLIYDLCQNASLKGLKVFLLGGTEVANKLAKEKLKNLYPNLIIDGYSPPYSPYPFEYEINKKILEQIESFMPDILFVGFGAPKQEFWIDDNLEILRISGVRFTIGVGGTFEMVAGMEKRAPVFIQKIGLESVWRLYQNPKRFGRFIKLFKFLKCIFK